MCVRYQTEDPREGVTHSFWRKDRSHRRWNLNLILRDEVGPRDY